jgi:hypothetical protein
MRAPYCGNPWDSGEISGFGSLPSYVIRGKSTNFLRLVSLIIQAK